MKFRPKPFQFLIILLAAALVGCKSPELYYWGHYESVVYSMYSKGGDGSPEKLAAILEEDEAKAASLNKPLPPGFHAQLGNLYAREGKTDDARKEYLLEEQKFPESDVFMDAFLGKAPNK